MSKGTNCVVGGGESNTESGTSTVIVGGFNNLAQSQDGFLGGGENNQLKGHYLSCSLSERFTLYNVHLLWFLIETRQRLMCFVNQSDNLLCYYSDVHHRANHYLSI